ncbi:hypothetical protein OAE18_01460 [Acidimicrobiia bacterium]|jgi:hypothetical protein|nr:hypothetical protein [Acidimicrobiia bacterium]MDA7736228.1 hypothetical protein [Acidimicrobiaceae bacterium]MDA8552747.1 hypothetical protein [bacterium]MDA8653454.1 hypothetical protein [Candidatus Actinomarina sp.]MDA7548157.1 hypothetical protein [Acidimicrobiia bacterium]|tara:strand:- start:547 stop:774 length:228 start_codon:yes stop_codon:yes gene_type:complete
MAKTQKVKISLQASLKEYEFEIEDKKKFTAEIETLIKDNGIYWYTDEEGEVGINAGNINSIEFAQEEDKREAGLV